MVLDDPLKQSFDPSPKGATAHWLRTTVLAIEVHLLESPIHARTISNFAENIRKCKSYLGRFF